jgi:hypothetical protein
MLPKTTSLMPGTPRRFSTTSVARPFLMLFFRAVLTVDDEADGTVMVYETRTEPLDRRSCTLAGEIRAACAMLAVILVSKALLRA